jgi:hypothetical protein
MRTLAAKVGVGVAVLVGSISAIADGVGTGVVEAVGVEVGVRLAVAVGVKMEITVAVGEEVRVAVAACVCAGVDVGAGVLRTVGLSPPSSLLRPRKIAVATRTAMKRYARDLNLPGEGAAPDMQLSYSSSI